MLDKARREALAALDRTYSSLYSSPERAPEGARERWREARTWLSVDAEQRRRRRARRQQTRAERIAN